MESRAISAETLKICYYKELIFLKQNIPNVISSLRLIVLPHLIFAFNHQLTFITYILFLFSISTDALDGYVARKLNSTSKIGGYMDVFFDFTFIFCMYLNFIIQGIYSPWILAIIMFVFSQFIFSNLILKKTVYDPLGKYYGSLLFAGVGLSLLVPNEHMYAIINLGIVIFSFLSFITRSIYLVRKSKAKNN